MRSREVSVLLKQSVDLMDGGANQNRGRMTVTNLKEEHLNRSSMQQPQTTNLGPGGLPLLAEEDEKEFRIKKGSKFTSSRGFDSADEDEDEVE